MNIRFIAVSCITRQPIKSTPEHSTTFETAVNVVRTESHIIENLFGESIDVELTLHPFITNTDNLLSEQT